MYRRKNYQGEALCEAIKKGDRYNITRLFNAGVNPLEYAEYYYPFELAIREGDIETITLFLTKYSPNTFIGSESILSKAVSYNKINVVEFLLEKGANLDQLDEYNSPLIFKTLEENYSEMLRYLLEKGANPNATRKYHKETPLHDAVESGKVEIVKLLLEFKADVTIRDDKGRTPILRCGHKAKIEIFSMLLAHGANIMDRLPETQETILHLLTNYDIDHEIFEFLLANGANINDKRYDGCTPLHLAYWNPDLMKFLIEKGANVKVRNHQGLSPLRYLIDNSSLNYVEGDKKEAINNFGQAMKVLLDAGAQINSRDIYLNTPLHSAMHKKDFEIVALLLDHGASLECTNKFKVTPLQVRHELNLTRTLSPKPNIVIVLQSTAGNGKIVEEGVANQDADVSMEVPDEDQPYEVAEAAELAEPDGNCPVSDEE